MPVLMVRGIETQLALSARGLPVLQEERLCPRLCCCQAHAADCPTPAASRSHLTKGAIVLVMPAPLLRRGA